MMMNKLLMNLNLYYFKDLFEINFEYKIFDFPHHPPFII